MNKTETIITPNEKQQECINTLKGPVMVLAGPGTGKTFTVIKRIKYMLEAGIKPSSVLCLTYSEAAANEMKSRLVKEAGTVAAAVCISTYHAFCNEVIRQYPEEFELTDNIETADDITKRNFLQKVIDEYKPSFYKTRWGDSYYYIPEILKGIDTIKSERITKEDYFNVLNNHPDWQGKTQELEAEYREREEKGKLVKTFLNTLETHKRKIGKAVELWDIFELYDTMMKKNNFIDFNDMINMTLETFENNPDFLKKVASKYEYFLVDEYQDTNYAQNSIVFLLAQGAQSRNIFVVGDDDQIIYEFQGAKTDTLEKFLMLFPDTKVICLKENNRSIQNILDFSYKVISSDKTRLESNEKFKSFNISKKLISKVTDSENTNNKIALHGFQDPVSEQNFIIDSVEKIIKNNKLPLTKDNEPDLSRIAILTRENRELATFASLTEARNIKYQIKENKSIFDIKSSLVLYFYLKTLYNHELHADKLFGLLLSEPFSFDYEDYNYLLKQNRLNHKDMITNIKGTPVEHKWRNPEKVNNFINTFNELSELKSSLNLRDLIISVINKSGILNYFLENDINRNDNISALKKITDEALAYMRLNKPGRLCGFLEHIDTAFECNIPINIDKEDFTVNAIQLVTLHGSKGREFDYVFIPGLISKKWEKKRVSGSLQLPIYKNDSLKSEDDIRTGEHLRLLFVGITRAKHSLVLSYSNSVDGKPQELTSYLQDAIKDNQNIETFNHELSKNDFIAEIATAMKKEPFDYSSAFKEEIKARIDQFRLSPSSMNTYLSCPRCFLYSDILDIPVFDADYDSAKYGIAIHAALSKITQYSVKNGSYPPEELMINEFINSLEKQEFNTEDIALKFKNRGLSCIKNYRKYFVQTPPGQIFATEYKFDFVPYKNNFLKGFIDRIEKIGDNIYEVYDYKTGSAKSKSQIADGKDYENYLNQLRFYKYAFELQNPGSKVKGAGLIFVEEPDGNFYTELSEIDNENIADKINFVYEKIKKLEFNPPVESERDCSYCNYRHLCKLSDMKTD